MKKGKILAALLVTFASSTAMAGSTTSNFQANAVMNSSCSVTSTNVNFGTINSADAVNATGTISFTCSKSVQYKLGLSSGSSGEIRSREMVGTITGNNDKLSYNLYVDEGRVALWGNGLPGDGGSIWSGKGSGEVQTNTIYGKVNSGQYIKPDTYSDNLIVSVFY
ncbi:spore coat U domain-containing protein [Janthinobacterium sp. 61]|uniref:Csu type fimbrial protein n=1 Tax=Janthinobacterium sp. 61 TaxID=2035209 RepID=UPI000C7055F2|nr:spore coat U domain-containing protein [Janthinobacterium sp. 61]